MIGGLKPGEPDARWLHATSTNKTPKGKETFEVDLPGMLNVDLTVKDVAHRYVFTVADIIDDKEADKVIWQPGKVAVLIRSVEQREGQGVEAKVHTVYKYAVLDMNNLSEKLELPIAEIKAAEKDGTLSEFIKARLAQLDMRNLRINQIMTEAALDEPFEGVTDPDKELYKNNLKDFIKSHFPKDKALMEGLEKFFANPASKTSKAYRQHLVSKLWWDTSSVIGKPKAATQKTDAKYTIKPEAKEAPYAHYAKANEMDGSPGKKMLRTDVLEMLDIPNNGLDEVNQFYVPMKDKFYYGGDKEVAGPGFIAVKVSERATKEGEFKYVYLNLSSLSKRTGIPVDTLKQAEKEGEVANVIRKQIGDLRADLPHIGYVKALQYIKAGSLLTSEVWPALENLKNLIQTHFPNQMKNFESIEAGAMSHQNKISFVEYLEEKLNITVDDFPEELLSHFKGDKIAVTKLNNVPIEWKAAASRPGNSGGEALRLKMFYWDTEGRYDIAVDDFAYRSRPDKYPEGMVPMLRTDAVGNEIWLLASIKSLKRLGLSESQIKEAVKIGDGVLENIIERKIRMIEDFSDRMSEFKRNAKVEQRDVKFLQDASKSHPDEKVRSDTKEYLKAYIKWADKKAGKKTAPDSEDLKALGTELMRGFVERLGDANLIKVTGKSKSSTLEASEKKEKTIRESSRSPSHQRGGSAPARGRPRVRRREVTRLGVDPSSDSGNDSDDDL